MNPSLIYFADLMRDIRVMDLSLIAIFGSLILVTAAVFIWAAFFRRRGHRSHSHSRRTVELPSGIMVEREPWAPFKKRRRRRKRRELPRNPTLAEAGGLPPIRTDEPPTSATPP